MTIQQLINQESNEPGSLDLSSSNARAGSGPSTVKSREAKERERKRKRAAVAVSSDEDQPVPVHVKLEPAASEQDRHRRTAHTLLASSAAAVDGSDSDDDVVFIHSTTRARANVPALAITKPIDLDAATSTSHSECSSSASESGTESEDDSGTVTSSSTADPGNHRFHIATPFVTVKAEHATTLTTNASRSASSSDRSPVYSRRHVSPKPSSGMTESSHSSDSEFESSASGGEGFDTLFPPMKQISAGASHYKPYSSTVPAQAVAALARRNPKPTAPADDNGRLSDRHSDAHAHNAPRSGIDRRSVGNLVPDDSDDASSSESAGGDVTGEHARPAASRTEISATITRNGRAPVDAPDGMQYEIYLQPVLRVTARGTFSRRRAAMGVATVCTALDGLKRDKALGLARQHLAVEPSIDSADILMDLSPQAGAMRSRRTRPPRSGENAYAQPSHVFYTVVSIT